MARYRSSLVLRQCPRCLKTQSRVFRRSIATSRTDPTKPQLPHILGYVPLPSRRLISLHGQDTYHFLQGLVTSNISPYPTLHSHYSAFLNASGRVLYDVFIYGATQSVDYRDNLLQGKDEPGLLIEVDANEVGNLAKHLKRFKLRAKVGIDIVEEEEWGVWQFWSDLPREIETLKAADHMWCRDPRAPGMGHRIVGARKKRPEVERGGTSEQYDLRRIMSGVAEGQTEIAKESALPQESNIDYMGGIDFRKGCYVGQELTIRVHHTGVVRKRILPVQLYDTEGTKPSHKLHYDSSSDLMLPPRGADISRADKKGRSAGKWLGGMGNIGLALCRLDVMTNTALTTEGSQWSPEHEFKVAWKSEKDGEDREVRVKAFVPEWHRERAEAQNTHRKKVP